MKICINAMSLLGPLSGVGVYTLNICRNLYRMIDPSEITYFYGWFSKKLKEPELPDDSMKLSSRAHRLLTRFNFLKRVVRFTLMESVRFNPKSFDVYWEPNMIPFKNIRRKRLVTTINDLSLILMPQWHRPELVDYFQKFFHDQVVLSDTIITPSEAVRQEVIQTLKIDAQRVHAIHYGIDHETFRTQIHETFQEISRRLGLPPNFLFFAGSLEPRKNLKGALGAYLSLPDVLRKEYPFLLAGPPGWENEEIHAMIRDNDRDVRHLGYLSTSDLAAVYNLAQAVIYPSHYEGFGFPPLEAMACNTPVIVSDIPVHREVCGDAALFVNPHNLEDIRAAIQKVFEDRDIGKSLSQKAVHHVAAYRWEVSAHNHAKILLGK